MLAFATATRPAQAQANFDRPGGDYLRLPVPSGDPADCALRCERDRRCRSWTFSYPTDLYGGAVCWLKSTVPARSPDSCCVSGVRGAGVLEPRNDKVETSIDRFGGDYRNFDVKGGDDEQGGRTADNKCRAQTHARPGYAGKAAHCFLEKTSIGHDPEKEHAMKRLCSQQVCWRSPVAQRSPITAGAATMPQSR